MARIPAYLFERLLFEAPQLDEIERFTQDGSVGREVWLACAADTQRRHRLLLTPVTGLRGVKLAAALHGALQRHGVAFQTENREGVVPLDSYVIATVGIHELFHVVLPLTTWWHDHKLDELLSLDATQIKETLIDAMCEWLQHADRGHERGGTHGGVDAMPALMRKAAPVLAAVGIFEAAHQGDLDLPRRRVGNPFAWLEKRLDKVAAAATRLFIQPAVAEQDVVQRVVPLRFGSTQYSVERKALIHRAFLDRPAQLAEGEGLSTIKADAATRLFEIRCKSLTWAVIDSGIDSNHPAFVDSNGVPDENGFKPSRVRAAYDFSRFDLVRNFNLTHGEPGSDRRNDELRRAFDALLKIPGHEYTAQYEQTAMVNLAEIARQLSAELEPDWALIEPLIRLPRTDGAELASDHGTLVAGVLGADWHRGDSSPIYGVCPDISIIDLRILSRDVKSTESAVIAALEFVRYLNRREFNQELVVHGVNVSLSIPYDPKRYGCGATPVCTAADRLSNSGVVVVVAAGNRGWSGVYSEDRALSSAEASNNLFQFCSITDPGNAHEVITVGATHRLKPHLHGVSYFSSRGPTGDGRIKPDVVAPGEKILGPVRGAATAERDGTSFSAPFVSGAAAMLMARHPELMGNPRRVKQIICETATDLGRERYFQGHGLVDVLRAIQSI
jgi:hypothetical protein